MWRKDLTAIVVAGLITSGCATIVNSPAQTVRVTSDPVGATVTVVLRNRGKDKAIAEGVTPLDVPVSRRTEDLVVQFQLEGCAPLEVHPKRRVSGWILPNLYPLLAPPPDGGSFAVNIAVAAAYLAIDFARGSAFTFPRIVTAKLCEREGATGKR